MGPRVWGMRFHKNAAYEFKLLLLVLWQSMASQRQAVIGVALSAFRKNFLRTPCRWCVSTPTHCQELMESVGGLVKAPCHCYSWWRCSRRSDTFMGDSHKAMTTHYSVNNNLWSVDVKISLQSHIHVNDKSVPVPLVCVHFSFLGDSIMSLWLCMHFVCWCQLTLLDNLPGSGFRLPTKLVTIPEIMAGSALRDVFGVESFKCKLASSSKPLVCQIWVFFSDQVQYHNWLPSWQIWWVRCEILDQNYGFFVKTMFIEKQSFSDGH